MKILLMAFLAAAGLTGCLVMPGHYHRGPGHPVVLVPAGHVHDVHCGHYYHGRHCYYHGGHVHGHGCGHVYHRGCWRLR